MSMLEIIQQVANANPSASKEEVSEAIVNCIGTVLPNIVKTVRAPIPSPIEVKRREFKLQRIPKRTKTRFKELTSEQGEFARELAWLRQKLDGGPSPNLMEVILQGERDSSVAHMVIPSNNSSPPLLPKIDGTPSSEIFTMQLGKLPSRIRSFSPYVAGIIEANGHIIPRFILSCEVEDRIGSDMVFAEFFRVVESTVRRFTQVSSLSWEFKVSSPTDIEAPWWKRVVLRITPLDTEFDKSMELWDKLDMEVRNAVESASVAAHPSESGRIRELNKNLFIEMNLD